MQILLEFFLMAVGNICLMASGLAIGRDHSAWVWMPLAAFGGMALMLWKEVL